MPAEIDLPEAVVETWRTCNRVTIYLMEHLPDAIWATPIPGLPRRTVRSIASHLHNCRCMWIRNVGARHGIAIPAKIDPHRATRVNVISALNRSGQQMTRLYTFGLERGGKLGGFPLDVVHFLAYHVAHEGHHRGQLCMIARQLGHRLPEDVQVGLWKWSRRNREA